MRSARPLRSAALLALLAMSLAIPLHLPHSNAQNNEAPAPMRPLDLSCCREALKALTGNDISRLYSLVLDQPVSSLLASMESGELTAYELTLFYLYRIATYDLDQLNSVIEINPYALALARLLDFERAEGTLRGPLHGIPVLLKDNISTADYLHTTAGAAALQNATAGADAYLVTQLHNAGAIILGKANMSEWANWMHYTPANGYSAVGGQVSSPYLDWLDPSGSSTGSAVAVSASFVPLAIGTETVGSIISPAARSGVVGFKPSLGLISRTNVIPITDELDAPGPFGITVTDVALAMNALSATSDPADPRSADASEAFGADFTANLDPAALQGKTIGLIAFDQSLSDEDQFDLYALWDEVEALESIGASVTVVRPAPFPDLDYGTLGSCDMHLGVDEWLTHATADVATLTDIVAWNDANPAAIPFGQERLADAASCVMTADEIAALGESVRTAARDYMETLFADTGVDVLLSIDELFALEYALAGYPAITVPHGTTNEGIPSGLTFVGPFLSDVELLGFAYAFEQTGDWRVPPPLVAAILSPE